MPFPGTRVIHQQWSAHHQPVARGAMTATVTITVPNGAGGWDPITGPVAGTAAAPTYTGAARVQRLDRAAGIDDAAGQLTTPGDYLIAVPVDAGEIPDGARVKVTECPEDATAVGKAFIVARAALASERFELDLFCSFDDHNQA